jgi:hypothetical protein
MLRLTAAAVASYEVARLIFPGTLPLLAPLTALLVVQVTPVSLLASGSCRSSRFCCWRRRIGSCGSWTTTSGRAVPHRDSRNGSTCGLDEIVERNPRVGEARCIDHGAALDQRPDRVDHVPYVDVHPGQHATVP